LPNVHWLEQETVTFTQIEDISKHFIDKAIDVVFDDGKVRISQGANENLAETREPLA
jgi:hypothetical protein